MTTIATCAVCGNPATHVLTFPTDASAPVGTLYCGPCTTSSAADFAPLPPRRVR